MNNFQLFLELLSHLKVLLPFSRPAVLFNLVLMVLSLAQSHNCHLGTLVLVWPVEGTRDSLIQRARRWLANRDLKPGAYYLPLAKHLL